MVVLVVLWYIAGLICYLKPLRSGESIASDSWKSVDRLSREHGIIGAVGGLVFAVVVMFFVITLGLLSWFFVWLTNQDR